MSRRFILSLVVLLECGYIATAAAQSDEIEERLARCAMLRGDVARLSCFDSLSKAMGLEGPSEEMSSTPRSPTGEAAVGDWTSSQTTNPIDDSQTVVLSLQAEEGASRRGQPVVFVARCKSNATEAYIIWNDYLGDDSSDVYDEWKYVTIRVGEGEAIQQRWSVSTDKKATFAPAWAGNLLKEMMTATSIVAQTTPYGENPVTATFDTTGMSTALAPLASTCNWSMDG